MLNKPEIAAVLECSTKLIHSFDHKPGTAVKRKCVWYSLVQSTDRGLPERKLGAAIVARGIFTRKCLLCNAMLTRVI
jgi:hypothetical protein